MTAFDALLPDADSSVRCSPHARATRIDPVGTAIQCDQLLLVEVPLPWPKPAMSHPTLAVAAKLAAEAPYPTTLWAAQPRSAGTAITVTRWRSTDGLATRAVHEVADVEELNLLISLLGTARDGSSTMVTPETPAPQALLICTQGSHDVCCGTDGTRFADEVSRSFPEMEMYRVSHTGGHRFAPTGMTFPDGRMWAWLDLEMLRLIVEQRGDVAEMGRHLRGWWGAKRGPAQAAERRAFLDHGWDWEREQRVVHHISDDDIVVASSRGEERYQVSVSREVPIISCRAEGGLPAKVAFEYSVEPRSRRRRE